jgi:hypothetical protein
MERIPRFLRPSAFGAFASTLILLGSGFAAGIDDRAPARWPVHDPNRPLPPFVTPGPAGSPIAPPSDAVVLFDGKDLSGWTGDKGQPVKWKVEKGFMEVAPKSGDIKTLKTFGDCQLHVEWASPEAGKDESYDWGNSGIYLMETYEVQVMDSFGGGRIYADGTAAAIYGQYPPIVNASRKPGEWQTFDIVFHRPRFDKAGIVLEPARMTVFHNGILVQDNEVLTGPTEWKARPAYKPHPDRLAVLLQDHGYLVRYRDIWIRDLEK